MRYIVQNPFTHKTWEVPAWEAVLWSETGYYNVYRKDGGCQSVITPDILGDIYMSTKTK